MGSNSGVTMGLEVGLLRGMGTGDDLPEWWLLWDLEIQPLVPKKTAHFTPFYAWKLHGVKYAAAI
jgi:hypothetical protein